MAKTRTIDQVVGELKMLLERKAPTREEKIRLVVDAYGVILSMEQGDWKDFQRERARCQKTGTASDERSRESH